MAIILTKSGIVSQVDGLVHKYHGREKKIHQDTPITSKLIVSLRTAIVSDEWKLNKQQTSHHDLLDSFRMALCNYEFPKNNTL